MNRFEGVRCLVTGTADGIGRATARKFLSEGGRVFACDLNGSGLADPNRMYFNLQNYAMIPQGERRPERPVHRQFTHGEESLGEVLDQDASNLWKVQRGMNSTGYRGLWISNQELRIRHFHKTIDDYLHRNPIKWMK